WPYFRRVRRGVYEILATWRRRRPLAGSRAVRPTRRGGSAAAAGIAVEVRESGVEYVAEFSDGSGRLRSRSLDEMAALVRGVARSGSADPGPLRLRVELDPERPDSVIEVYEKDIDRTLVRQSLRMGFEERLLALQNWMNDTEEIRGAARRRRRRAAR